MVEEIKLIDIGADPEFFLVKNGIYQSAEGIVGGTKKEPRSLGIHGFYVQEDNVSVEFNIPASKNGDDLSANIKTALNLIRNIVPHDIDFCKDVSADFPEDQLQTEQAKLFGCDPDFDCWRECQNDSPCSTTNMRTAGGHIHVAYENNDIDITLKLVKLMDLFLGVPSILLDKDERRKQMYGKAGAFRFKNYGFEYRSLSSFWIWSDEHIKFVAKQVQRVIDEYNKDEIQFDTELSDMIVNTINSNDKDLAKYLIDKYNIM